MILKCFVLFLLTGGFGTLLYAQPDRIPWQGKDFIFVSRGTPVANVLKDMGANFQIPVVVSPDIRDIFSGRLEEKSPEAVLDFLANTYHLAWYYNNQALYIYKADAIISEVITPSYLSTQRVERYLRDVKALGIGQCHIVNIKGIRAFEVVGVPACVDKVAELAKKLDEKAVEQDDSRQVIRMFPLKYASATDSVYSYRGTNVTVPGIVSILRDMASNAMTNTVDDGAPRIASGSASFSADSRQNSVIVHDKASNMPLYARLIPKLDVKPTQIQISATIVDVSTDKLDELGVNWQSTRTWGGTNFTSQTQFSSGSANAFTSLIDTGSFRVTLTALEKSSKAKVLSRPSVITLNNIQAVLDSSTTFYTKLEAQDAVKLESVSSGSLLRVTPRIIDSRGKRDVLLVLNIQDGGQADSTVDGLPQVTNSEITTQATLSTGQSLLLGGFIKDTTTRNEEKIPLFGDLPVVGFLFRSRQDNQARVARLFLISAEPVDEPK